MLHWEFRIWNPYLYLGKEIQSMEFFQKPGENSDGHVVYGPHGNNIKESGSHMFTRQGIYRVSGDMIFGPNGSTVRKSGHMIVQSKSNGKQRIVTDCGCNHWHTDEGDYRLSGNILYGPSGRIWRGVEDAAQAERIIATDF